MYQEDFSIEFILFANNTGFNNYINMYKSFNDYIIFDMDSPHSVFFFEENRPVVCNLLNVEYIHFTHADGTIEYLDTNTTYINCLSDVYDVF